MIFAGLSAKYDCRALKVPESRINSKSMVRVLLGFAAFCCTVLGVTPDELALLHDSGGWEYQTITDANNGFETQAVCFVEAFTGQCRGTLLFRDDGTFTQTITAHGRSMHRGGKYRVDGSQLTFWDEHNTQDGPYSMAIDQNAKTLGIETTQAGVKVQMKLLLEREFKKQTHSRKAR
jgi:hypothetical protein